MKLETHNVVMLGVLVELETGDGGDDSGLVPLPPLGVLEVVQQLVTGVQLTPEKTASTAAPCETGPSLP